MFFFFQAEDGIRDATVTGVQTCALPIWLAFAAGIVASVAANIAAAQPSIGARIVAGWPALAQLLVVELLSRSGRKIEKLAVLAPTEQVPSVHPGAVAAAASPSLPQAPVSPAAYGTVSGHLGRPRMPVLSRPAE